MNDNAPSRLFSKSLIFFLFSRISSAVNNQILTIAVGWQMYMLTKSAFYLGLIGLVQFLPMLLLTLVVGYVADRFDRRRIVCICQLMTCLSAGLLAFGSLSGWITKESILTIVFIIGAINAFQSPSLVSMLPNIVTMDQFPRAAALSSSIFQAAVILGPALGGFLYIFGPGVVYTIVAVLALINSVLVIFVTLRSGGSKKEPVNLKSLLGGITFIRSKPQILGAISLDLFAVLFGGATALLPVYASTILNVGSVGLGFLRFGAGRGGAPRIRGAGQMAAAPQGRL